MRRRIFKFIFIAAIVCLLALSGLYGLIVWSYLQTAQNSWQIEIEIPKDSSVKEIAAILERTGVVRSAKVFEIFVRLKGEDKNIKAGLYEFTLPIRQSELLKKLVKGDVKLVKITVPEGLTIREIDARLAERKIANSGEFERAARSSPISKKYGADTLEGFLFPDTYLVKYNVTVEELIGIMTKRFDEVFDSISAAEQQNSRAEEGAEDRRGFLTLQTLRDKNVPPICTVALPHCSTVDIVTLASLIEKETSVDEERPLVSAVFHNRLKKNMRLQSDPSVIYGLKEFDGNLTKEHLQSPHPYNTYVHAGLPKGPICNPGKSSLVAALNPADVDYLYFVSKGDGTHFFSSDYAAHTKAVWKYQMNK